MFEKRFGVEEKGTVLLSEFLDEVYLPWSKANKKSWRDDAYMLPMLKEYFEGKTLREISAQFVEEFKNNRLNTPTKKNTPRRPATVNLELTLLSSAYSLAVKYDKAESNPCSNSHRLAETGCGVHDRAVARTLRCASDDALRACD